MKWVNLHKSIINTAEEFEEMIYYTIPVDTGRLYRSTTMRVWEKGFEYYAEDYIHYLITLYTIRRTDGRTLYGEVAQNLSRDPNIHLPTFYKENINTDRIDEGIKKDIKEWLEQKLK